MSEAQKSEYLCPECAKPFDPTRGLGSYGVAGTKDGVRYEKELGVQMTCGQHTWQLPGKTVLDVIAACPVLAPEYIAMTLADQAIRRIGI